MLRLDGLHAGLVGGDHALYSGGVHWPVWLRSGDYFSKACQAGLDAVQFWQHLIAAAQDIHGGLRKGF